MVESEPDATIDLYQDKTLVEAIHSETGLRGYGETEADALHTLSVIMAKRERAENAPDEAAQMPAWLERDASLHE